MTQCGFTGPVDRKILLTKILSKDIFDTLAKIHVHTQIHEKNICLINYFIFKTICKTCLKILGGKGREIKT